HWLSYLYSEPCLETFRERRDREPKPKGEDYEELRRIRGEFHTQFLREAKSLLADAGMKLESHVESRMTTGPECDTYTQIHWDVATWIDEGILDGVNLKYLQTANPWVQREVLPRAKARGIPVHEVAAIGDPRSQPRTPEMAADWLENAIRHGGSGLDLYELWVYLRTTPEGKLFHRGCSKQIFARLKEVLDRA
ncbi:MAG: hypothetical protein ACYTGH_14800, partial [Planctomycetota bacterium]